MFHSGISGNPRTLSTNARRRERKGVQIHRLPFARIVINSTERGRGIIISTSTKTTCIELEDMKQPSTTLIYSASNRRFGQVLTRKRLKTPLIFRGRNLRPRGRGTAVGRDRNPDPVVSEIQPSALKAAPVDG